MIVVLDFGSQYTQLIARRIRELGVLSVIHSYDLSLDKLREINPKGIILSGGPQSCYADDAPQISKEIFQLGIPVLGICYGFQLMAHLLGGEVVSGEKGEYGSTWFVTIKDCPLWKEMPFMPTYNVWASHGDSVRYLPEGFNSAGGNANIHNLAAWHPTNKFFGLQFHPEVSHTEHGEVMIKNFIDICNCGTDWVTNVPSIIEKQVNGIKEQVGDSGGLICGLSGGVDSSVAALLTYRAVGDRLSCIFVDNGLLRAGELAQVKQTFFGEFGLPLIVVDAERRFLDKLKGVSDPEKKRKIIGNEFIAVFEEEAKELIDVKYLVQGTLYPDVIESVSSKGPAAVIKSHHNVGGLPEDMDLTLVEPLREFFKDEVRKIGEELGLSDDVLWRHPFPGPGLAIRILGEVTKEKLDCLRKADSIIEDEIKKANQYYNVWQAFGVLLPVCSVGVMGDDRTYERTLVLRAVDSDDGMTANWSRLPYELLNLISSRVINEVSGINRVVYDISSKPPATIEWE
jgi:GMP synthase (glutamine-hydrolysing)